MSIRSIFTRYKYPQHEDVEIQAEIAMLKQVLSASNVHYSPPGDIKSLPEIRTLLISQLKKVSTVSMNQHNELSSLRLEVLRLGDIIKQLQNKGFELTDENKKLREENEFLRNTKEKVFILREMR